MNQDETGFRFLQVQATLKKLGKAYASGRIHRSLYRSQRKELVYYLINSQATFPNIILNQESQSMSVHGSDQSFADEATPVVDDLGFSDPNVSSQTTLLVPGNIKSRINNPKSFEQTPEPQERDYYWYFLAFFIIILTILAVIVLF